MKKNILLTGASGSVGIETLKELLSKNRNFNVKIFDIKTPSTKKKLKPYIKKTEIFWGDVTNFTEVEKAVKECDFIIHTAALIPPEADRNPELAEKINVKGTENICNAVNKHNPDAFLIFTSSISVYGDRLENPLIKVSDKLKPSPKDFYAETKIKAEEIIKVKLKNFTVFRLSAVMNPEMKPDPLLFHMPLNTSLEIVTAKDTAFALVEAIEKKEYLNNIIFNLGGGEKCRISYKDFLKKNFEIFGLKDFNFPENAFAEKNFHCGFYEDSYLLNDILHFQRDSLDDYFMQVEKSIKAPRKFFASVFNKTIKKRLLKKSDPYNAVLTNNAELKKHFFKKAV